jgi:UDP-2-acetamido-3-amino-2,3-dideoxy-glucuronate N-acetyltransferase
MSASEVEIEDDVYIGGGATFSAGKPILLKRGCHIGANTTLSAGISVGERAVVEAGAVVLQSVPPNVVVAGNPAKVIGFAETENARADKPQESNTAMRIVDSKVRGVRAYELPYISDPRGNLTVGEFGTALPFIPKRYFVTFDVPSFHLRGEHAHHKCEQFLVCVRGSCAVVVDDGASREEFLLDRPTFGVYVPPMVWATEYKHSPDSTLLVFASHHYDPTDYIRDYDEFRAQARKPSRKHAR